MLHGFCLDKSNTGFFSLQGLWRRAPTIKMHISLAWPSNHGVLPSWRIFHNVEYTGNGGHHWRLHKTEIIFNGWSWLQPFMYIQEEDKKVFSFRFSACWRIVSPHIILTHLSSHGQISCTVRNESHLCIFLFATGKFQWIFIFHDI